MNHRYALRASFARIIKQWRLSQNRPQKQMAMELELGISTVSAWETNKNFPDGDTLADIVKLTHITPCRLFCDRAERCPPGQCRFLTGPLESKL